MSDDALRRITDLVEPSLRQCGVELYDAQFTGAGGHATLRLLIDREGGVSLDDCERVSTAVSAVLDAHDPIDGAYALEVSSPGAERPLRDRRDWQRQVGRRVNVRLHAGDADEVVEGRLLAVDDGGVEVEVRERRGTARRRVEWHEVDTARLAVEI